MADETIKLSPESLKANLEAKRLDLQQKAEDERNKPIQDLYKSIDEGIKNLEPGASSFEIDPEPYKKLLGTKGWAKTMTDLYNAGFDVSYNESNGTAGVFVKP